MSSVRFKELSESDGEERDNLAELPSVRVSISDYQLRSILRHKPKDNTNSPPVYKNLNSDEEDDVSVTTITPNSRRLPLSSRSSRLVRSTVNGALTVQPLRLAKRRYKLLSREKLLIPKKNKDGRYLVTSAPGTTTMNSAASVGGAGAGGGGIDNFTQQPLLSLNDDKFALNHFNNDEDDDDDEDSQEEADALMARKMTNRELREQLLKDGFNLDVKSDDDDLDLIPPRPLEERCICCNYQINCTIL